MGLSSLRRHRGDYADRQMVHHHRQPAADTSAELAAARARIAELEAQVVDQAKNGIAKLTPELEAEIDAEFKRRDELFESSLAAHRGEIEEQLASNKAALETNMAALEAARRELEELRAKSAEASSAPPAPATAPAPDAVDATTAEAPPTEDAPAPRGKKR